LDTVNRELAAAEVRWAIGAAEAEGVSICLIENCYASVIFGLAKDIYDYLIKSNFLHLVAFLSFFVFC
jgi:hypothetical protein